MRQRILLLVVGMTTLVVLAFAIPLAVLISNNAYQDGTKALQREASDIARFLGQSPTSIQLAAYLDRLTENRLASVEGEDGTVAGTRPPHSADLPAATNNDGDRRGDRSGGPHDEGGPPQEELVAWHGGRLAQVVAPGSNLVRVWASDDTLHAGEDGRFLLLGGAAIGLILLGVIAGELLTRRIVRPLVKTASTAQQLSAGDTTARAPTDGPGEIADVGRALNRLADRIDELIAEERETVADLSHRLRTPLTALRLDAEALQDPADAERVGSHVSALERMLTAVIRAARRPQREGRLPSCDATQVVATRVAFWSALAEDQGRAGTIDLPSDPLAVRAAAEDLAAAVDALLENVVAHTPEGTPFTVRLVPSDVGARLEVSDDGPGLPPDEPVRGRSDRGSSGLGLDIARRCAEAAGGWMTLGASPSGGASITLELGVP